MDANFVIGGGGIVVGLFLMLLSVLSLACTAVWVWMLIDCVMNEPSEGNDKLIWILLIVFVPWIGGLAYFFLRRPERKNMYGR